MPNRHLFELAAAAGVHVEYADLPEDRDGEYDHDSRTIYLRADMAMRLHRSVLAHELGHAVFGDIPSKFGPVNAKQERRAEEWGALQLISLDAYRLAETIHNGHPGAMALELNVMRSTLEAFARVLLRVGDTVYVDPRMGAGQWLHAENVPA